MTASLCTVAGCNRTPVARSWCRPHYLRAKSSGDPTKNLRMTTTQLPLVEKAWRYIERDSSGCWMWTGGTMNGDYGHVWTDGRSAQAHRALYEILVEKVPDGLVLDHLCRVRRCVNPAHLEVVTTAENLRRGRVSRGIEQERV